MSVWKAEWSGKYPCLCSGKWTLYRDGEIVNVEIPFQETNANTFGIYNKWYFDEDYNDIWFSYEDGYKFEDWKNFYQDFLSKLTQDEQEWEKIYLAFASNDWRLSSCGGCI